MPNDPVALWADERTRRYTVFFEIAYRLAILNGEGVVAEIEAYDYEISDRDGHEILTYHWHPEGVSPVTEPHLHLSGRLRPLDLGPRDAPVALGEMHLPTGVVTLAQVVQLLITEFGVEPRREDWGTVLRAADSTGSS